MRETLEKIPAVAASPGAAAAVFAEQIRMLYHLSRPAYSGTLAVALTTVIALAAAGVSVGRLGGWMLLVVAVTAGRFVLYRKFFAAGTHEDYRPWARRFVIGAVAMGFLWGLLGSFVMADAGWYYQLLVIFVIVGVVASALILLTPYIPAYVGFAASALVPSVIALFVAGDFIHLFTATIVTAFSAVMLAACPIVHGTHVGSLRARFENAGLVERLTAASETADDAIAQLSSQLEDQKRIEQALQEATDRLEALIAASPLAIVQLDLDLQVDRWNPAAERMFGWTQFEVLGRTTPIVPPELLAEAKLHRDRILKGATFAGVESVRQRRDGSRIDVSVSAAAIYNSNGEVAGLVAMFADISEHKRDRDALQRANARLEALVNASPLAIMVQDEQGIIRRWNNAAQRIFGWAEEEAVGRRMFAVPEDRKEETRAFRERILRGDDFTDVETVRRRKDGSLIPVSLSAAPLHDAQGGAMGIVLLAADISERKRSERRQNIQNVVTLLLAEAERVEEVIPRIIQTLCESLGFEAGARRVVVKDDGFMHHREDWGTPDPAIQSFLRKSTTRVSAGDANAGLLRRVWALGKPVWIADLEKEPTFIRGEAALAAGLRCAFAFPIMVSDEFYGVIELFGREVRERDEEVVRVTGQIVSQIGQFIARKEAESHLMFFANHDTLTGLPNRAMFNDRLTQALARAQRLSKMVAVLFIDLDRFKIINDTLGHDAGDQLLKQLADRLRDSLRESDTIGRQGGDEFVVLIEDVSEPGQVGGIAQKILDTVARPYSIDSQEFHVTASVGISIYPDDGSDLQTLLKNADIAMYRAKEQGKNNFKFYSTQMDSHSFARLALETSLRRAVERNEFLLHYQPKVDMRDGRITGVEALVRWQHPELGLLEPAHFIPLAEETGLINPIGEWVLRTACAQAQAWIADGMPPIVVAVNVSARQFSREDMAASIMHTLRETALDPRLLELELTESTVMHNAERATEVLQQLSALGVRVAIDDFGTGYSSLSYLKRFPIDSVKIDRSFVLDVPGDKDDEAITLAVIAMAHSLRLRVTAEGVETPEQYAFLEENRCDEMQGHYFSKPVDAATLARLLAGRYRNPKRA